MASKCPLRLVASSVINALGFGGLLIGGLISH